MSNIVSKSFGVSCPNLTKARAALKTLGSNGDARGCLQAIKKGFQKWGQPVRTKILYVTPKDKGILRGSIRVKSNTKGSKATIEFSAGGAAAAYAEAIHEHPSEASPPSWKGKELNWTTPGTGTHYIEIPVKEDLPKLDDVVADSVNRAIKRVMPK